MPHYYLRTLAPNKAAASFSSCSSCSSPSAPRNSSAPCNCCAARRTLPAPLSSVLRRTLPTPRSQSSESSRSLCANTPGRRCGAGSGAGAGAGLGQRVRAFGLLLHRLRARAPRRAWELQVSRGRSFPCAVRVSSVVPHTKPARRHGKWPLCPRLRQVARRLNDRAPAAPAGGTRTPRRAAARPRPAPRVSSRARRLAAARAAARRAGKVRTGRGY